MSIYYQITSSIIDCCNCYRFIVEFTDYFGPSHPLPFVVITANNYKRSSLEYRSPDEIYYQIMDRNSSSTSSMNLHEWIDKCLMGQMKVRLLGITLASLSLLDLLIYIIILDSIIYYFNGISILIRF